MISLDFAPIELSRYELRLRARGVSDLPAFLGSTLRGAFGHALKEAVCVMEHRDCERCMVADRCIYPYLFETPAPPDVRQLRGQQRAPHPFILTPPVPDFETRRVWSVPAADATGQSTATMRTVAPSEQRRRLAAGDELEFGLLLMGRATEYLPYIVYAVSEMARRGLGANRSRFELSDVSLIDGTGAKKVIYSGESQRITVPKEAVSNLSDLVQSRLDQTDARDRLKLRFLTPTRIRVEGDLQTGLSFELLARNLLRRISMLAAVHGRAPLELDYRALIERAATVMTHSSELRWRDWERYSNRQKTKMKLGGFAGEIEYEGECMGEFLPLVIAGEILHVGAGTGFGLGRYEIAE